MRSIFGNRWGHATVDNPVAFFYLFRFITWALAVIIYLTDSAAEVNLRYGLGLVLYTLLHLILGTAYAIMVHPQLASNGKGLTLLRPLHNVLAIGSIDMIASLFVVYFSGGWGSPFWHFAVTSLLVPCFLVTFRWAMLITTTYAGMYAVMIVLGGEGLQGNWLTIQRHLFIGFIFTAYLVGMAVSYLGHVFRELDMERLRAGMALNDLGTLYDVTRNVISATADVDALLQHVAQTMRQHRPAFGGFAIYLQDADDGILKLSSSSVSLEELGESPALEPGEGLVGKAASLLQTQMEELGASWRVATPIRNDDTLLGVMLLGSRVMVNDGSRAVNLAEALANQVAIGIQNARLQRQQVELAAQEERNRIAREIHDGIAQSMYALSLSLETCADLAEREKGPLRERLQKLVPLAKQTLLETRHYIYDLKPLLSGESSLASVAENQVKEFQMVSGIPVKLEIKGAPYQVPVSAGTGFYRILQEVLANVLKHASASEVEIELAFEPGWVRLSAGDDRVGFDPEGAAPGYGLNNMRQRAEELGGSVEISSAPGKGTSIRVSLPAQEAN